MLCLQHYLRLQHYLSPSGSARPIAQLVERWAPGSDSPGLRCSSAHYVILLAGMVRDWWQQLRPVEDDEWGMPCQLCGHVKLLALNSAIILELTTGGWESGPTVQSLLPAGLDFPDPSIQNFWAKIINSAVPPALIMALNITSIKNLLIMFH